MCGGLPGWEGVTESKKRHFGGGCGEGGYVVVTGWFGVHCGAVYGAILS